MSIRVSDQVAHIPKRKLNPVYGAGTNKSVGTTSPNSIKLTRNERRNLAMGMIGDDNILSFETDTAGDVKLWVWHEPTGKWKAGGANSSQHTKTYEADAIDCWTLTQGSLFFLTASVELAVCHIDASPFPGNPNASTQVDTDLSP